MVSGYLIITVDTEAQPPRQSENHVDRLIYGKSKEGSFGIGEMMEIADRYSKKITFFVDIIAERIYPGEIRDVCMDIHSRGHDVQLHSHPEYADESFWRELDIPRQGAMNRWNAEQSSKIITWMIGKCEDWGIPRPVALRGGGYRYNAHILQTENEIGLTLDFNYNHLNRKVPLKEPVQPQPFNLGPLPVFRWSNGIVEVPVSTFSNDEDPAKHATRIRFDENFVMKYESDLHERMRKYYSETKGPPILVMMIHSWSLLGYDKDSGYYVFDDAKKRDGFERFLRDLPDDIHVITASEIHEMSESEKLDTKLTLDLDFARY